MQSLRRSATVGWGACSGRRGATGPMPSLVVCTRLKSGTMIKKLKAMRDFTDVRNPACDFDHPIKWTDDDERHFHENPDHPQPEPIPYEQLANIAVRCEEEKRMLHRRIPRSQHLEMLSFRKAHGLMGEKERLPAGLMMEDGRQYSQTRKEKHEYLQEVKDAEEAEDKQKEVDLGYQWKAKAGLVQDAGLSVPYWGWDDEASEQPSRSSERGRDGDSMNTDDPSDVLPIIRFKNNYKNPRQNDGYVPGRRLRYELEADYDKDAEKNTPKVLAEKYGLSRDQVRGIIILKHLRESQHKERRQMVAEAHKELEPSREDLPFLPKNAPMPNVNIRDCIDALLGCDPRMNIEPHQQRAPDHQLKPKRSPLPTFLTDEQLAQLLEKEKPTIKFRPDLFDRTFWPERQSAANMLPPEQRVVMGSMAIPKQKGKRSFTFVDMSKSASPKVRGVLKRDNDGQLREADFLTRRRLNQKANPQPGYRKHSWLDTNDEALNQGADRFYRIQQKKWDEQVCVKFFNELRASNSEGQEDRGQESV